METYYNPVDLNKFAEISEGAPELAKKFFDYYSAVFAEGELTEREKPAGDRNGSHPEGARIHQLAHRRRPGGRAHSGHEPLHPALPHAQTGNSKALKLINF